MARTQALGFAAAAAATLAWPAGFFLPWLATLPAGAADLGREGLVASGVAYERGIVLWPLAVLPAAALGAATATASLRSARTSHLVVPSAALAFLCACIAGIGAARMAGFAAVRAMDPGAVELAPGPAALAVLAAGSCVAAWSGHALRRQGAAIPWPTAAAAATLALMPFLPFGASGSGAFLYDELSIAATVASGDGLLEPAGRALAWMRGGLWATLAAGALLCAFLPRAPALRRPRVRLALLAPGPVVAAGFGAWFLARWAAVDGLGVTWNAAVPLGLLATLATLVRPASMFSHDPDDPRSATP